MAASPSSQSPRRTASTCTPETARGTHTFRIEGYSLFRDLGVGKCVQSAIFSVGGYDWSICFYPDGDTEEEGRKGWVSVYLVLKTNDAVVRAIYDLTLVDQTCTPPPPTPPSFRWPNPSVVDPVVFDNRGSHSDASGYFFRKTELVKDSPYVLDDAIVF